MLEFVTSTGEPSKSNRDETAKRVRQQAMRHYLEQQQRLAATGTNELVVEHLIEEPSLYKGRFKLPTWTHKAKGRSYPGRRGRKTKSNRSSDASASKLKAIEAKEIDSYGYLSATNLDKANYLDPFDSLSIHLSRQSKGLLRYYHSSYSMNSVAINPEGNFFSAVRDDPAVFHSILNLVSLDFCLRYGAEETFSSWYHAGEAFKAITQQLDAGRGTQTALTAIAIAMLVNKENIDGNYELAKIHMKGLSQLIKAGNGIQGLKPVFQRIIIWSDFCFAAVWNRAPSLPLLPASTGLSEDSLAIAPDLLSLEQLDLTDILPANSPMINIFRMLRMVSSGLDPHNVVSTNLLAASEMIYQTEYEILLLNNLMSTVLQSGLECYTTALNISAHLYLWLVIRGLPPTSELVYLLVQRLQNSLDLATLNWGSVDDDGAVWLLWMFFIGAVASGQRPERRWFVDQLSTGCNKLGIESSELFALSLKKILWRDDWCTAPSKEVWSDIKLSSPAVLEII